MWFAILCLGFSHKGTFHNFRDNLEIYLSNYSEMWNKSEFVYPEKCNFGSYTLNCNYDPNGCLFLFMTVI